MQTDCQTDVRGDKISKNVLTECLYLVHCNIYNAVFLDFGLIESFKVIGCLILIKTSFSTTQNVTGHYSLGIAMRKMFP